MYDLYLSYADIIDFKNEALTVGLRVDHTAVFSANTARHRRKNPEWTRPNKFSYDNTPYAFDASWNPEQDRRALDRYHDEKLSEMGVCYEKEIIKQ